MFDNKYMNLFDARPNAIRTFGFRIKQFLTVSNIHFGNAFVFCATTIVCQTTKNCAGSDASEERSHRCICLQTIIHGNNRRVP